MDATEYVGRRAQRALGLLPAALVVVAALGAVAGLVGLWRLTTPSTGFVGGNAAGSLWQRVTMSIATGYDVAPLAWGSVALVVVAVLVRTPLLPGPTPSGRVRRAAALLAGAVTVLSVVALVLVVVWAVLTRGEVSFSVEVPGDQSGGAVTTQVGTYLTDPWTALLHVVPAAAAAVLAAGALAALLHPSGVAEVVQVAAVAGVGLRPQQPAAAVPATGTVRASMSPDPAPPTAPDTVPPDAEPVVVAADPSVFARDGSVAGAARAGRGSGGAARFARSIAAGPHERTATHPGPEPTSADPLAGWTMGPGATSDVAYRRPGAGGGDPQTEDRSANGSNGSDASNGSNGSDSSAGSEETAVREGAVPTRDPYRRPGA